MYTFIELQGFSKRRQELLPDDEFRKIRWGRPGMGNAAACG